MISVNAEFYFANLGADVARCITAAEENNIERYTSSLARAHKTLRSLRAAHRPEAYEEGLLLVRALEYARREGRLEAFRIQLNDLIARYSPLAQ